MTFHRRPSAAPQSFSAGRTMLSPYHSQNLPCFSRTPAQHDESMQRASLASVKQGSVRTSAVLQPFRSGMQLPLFTRQVGRAMK